MKINVKWPEQIIDLEKEDEEGYEIGDDMMDKDCTFVVCTI